MGLKKFWTPEDQEAVDAFQKWMRDHPDEFEAWRLKHEGKPIEGNAIFSAAVGRYNGIIVRA